MRKLFAFLLMTLFAATHLHAAAISIVSDSAGEVLSAKHGEPARASLVIRASGECCRMAQDIPAKASHCPSDCVMSIADHAVAFSRFVHRPTAATAMGLADVRRHAVFRPPISP